MAVPIVLPLLVTAGRSVALLLRRWQGVLALTGLIFATGFSLNGMIDQMGKTAVSLWPLLALGCFFFLS
ncbi:hypothetical protein [Billgrantia ethanolica]|uniref:Uncharacterized protein n=1 Tax=Billgrantia ethanolica TaxID=2733486 RepID=A0ABS9A6E4_9GAMM|nr:hypothetical protein [Halomonas ethanolica]MCE8004407.1 hypothetical protein [Halomonas ethanolica]